MRDVTDAGAGRDHADGRRAAGRADDRGTIEPGKRADLVVADGDPLDISELEHRISTVIQNGKVVSERT